MHRTNSFEIKNDVRRKSNIKEIWSTGTYLHIYWYFWSNFASQKRGTESWEAFTHSEDSVGSSRRSHNHLSLSLITIQIVAEVN